MVVLNDARLLTSANTVSSFHTLSIIHMSHNNITLYESVKDFKTEPTIPSVRLLWKMYAMKYMTKQTICIHYRHSHSWPTYFILLSLWCRQSKNEQTPKLNNVTAMCRKIARLLWNAAIYLFITKSYSSASDARWKQYRIRSSFNRPPRFHV